MCFMCVYGVGCDRFIELFIEYIGVDFIVK